MNQVLEFIISRCRSVGCSFSIHAALLLLLITIVPASAGPQEDVNAAYHRGDYVTMIKISRPLAEKGDTWFQIMLGLTFEGGLGVPQDYVQAVGWYRKAAIQGDSSGQFNLARMYLKGNGVQEDQNEGISWLRKAAQQSEPRSQNMLGMMGLLGNEASIISKSEAVNWIQKSANQGYRDAQLNLALMYYAGQNVVQDYVLAHMWANLAAASLPEGKDRELAVSTRNSVEQIMTRDQIALAQRKARQWKPR